MSTDNMPPRTQVQQEPPTSELEIRLNDDGSLDEICGLGFFHLEQMDTNHWWMRLDGRGLSVAVWLHARGKITASYEHRAASPQVQQEPVAPC